MRKYDTWHMSDSQIWEIIRDELDYEADQVSLLEQQDYDYALRNPRNQALEHPFNTSYEQGDKQWQNTNHLQKELTAVRKNQD